MKLVRRGDKRTGGAGRAGARRAALAAALPLCLAACTPAGWIDPAEWFSGPSTPPQRVAAADAASPGPYPWLGSMPEGPSRPSAEVQRDRWVEGLLADRRLASYTTPRPEAGAAPAEPAAPTPAPPAVVRPAPAPAVSTRPLPPGPAPGTPPRRATPEQAPQAAVRPPLVPPGPEPGAERAEPDLGQVAAARGELVGVIYFLAGSTRVDARDRRILGDIVLLQAQRGGVIHLVGHASGRTRSPDPAAQRLGGFALSLDRARAVALALRELGAPGPRLVAASDSEPVYDESAPSGEAGNRRVEIFLEY
jgi:outer membrane protein OmpA-like peptidoglycan-associated protein